MHNAIRNLGWVRGWGVAGVLALSAALPTAAAPLDPVSAQAAFAEAKAVSDADGGRLWGKPLYGPILLVDTTSRALVTNEPDAQGRLKPRDGVYVGTLEREEPLADTAFDWSGKLWTMLMWPLSEDATFRKATFAHEMFHRLQPQYGLMMSTQPCAHLDTIKGRVWVQLEWRALAKALAATGPGRTRALADALAFRARRHRLFPEAAECERRLDLVEGTAEYTGLRVGVSGREAAVALALHQLANVGTLRSFVRFYPYISGPAYGLVLDDLKPGWPRTLSGTDDLAHLVAAKIPFDPQGGERRAAAYGAAALWKTEIARAKRVSGVLADYRKTLVDGPTLRLPNVGSFRFGFRPGVEIAIEGHGTVYPVLHASDAWGILDVSEGGLLAPNFSAVTVAAPIAPVASAPSPLSMSTEGRSQPQTIVGPGWTLTLNTGWHVVALQDGRYSVAKDPP